MKKTRLRITLGQGHQLMMLAGRFALPDKLGDSSFNQQERALANRDILQLYDVLCSNSESYQKERKPYFGPESVWSSIVSYENGRPVAGMQLKDECVQEEVTLVLSSSALWGIRWCLLALCHPSSGLLSSAVLQREIVWPLAERIGAREWLEKSIGLDRAEHKEMTFDKDFTGEFLEEIKEPSQEGSRAKS